VARGRTGVWYLTDAGGDWTRVRLTRDGDTAAGDPQIARDPVDGSLAIVYVDWLPDDGGVNTRMYLTRHPAGAGDWSAPRRVPGASLWQPSLVVRDGVVAIAAAVGMVADVAFLTDATGRWTRDDIDVAGERAAEGPSLALDRQGRPVIAYMVHGAHPKANAIRLAQGTTRSGAFSTTRVVAEPGVQGPSLVIDEQGRARFVIDADAGTYLARPGASGWQLRRVWRDGQDSQLLLGPDGRYRIVGLRDDGALHAWAASGTSAGWRRTQLSTHPTEDVTFAVSPSDGRDHVVDQVGERLWYTRSR
jgi:hypothetical protein